MHSLPELLEKIGHIIRNEAIPLEPEFLSRPFRDLLPRLAAIRQRVKADGLWAPYLPQAWGGMGLTLMDYARVSEELGRSPLGHFLFHCQAPDVGNLEILLEFGNAEQKQNYLTPLAHGEVRSCFAMTEPEYPGSNPTWMNTQAVKDGDEYVINGHKWFTSSADGAAFAIVMAVTNPNDPIPHKRASQILVPTNTPGFKRVRNISVMGDVGSDHHSHSEIRLENCRVPITNRLGGEGDGFVLAQHRLGPGRIHHCMRWIGICERAFDMMCERAAVRELSPGKPLGARQMVQDWIAESRAEINASRLLVLQAAEKIQTQGSHAARQEISIIKFYVANVLQRVVDRALQTFGAAGMTDDFVLSYWYRHERAARIYDGPDEVHKSLVARMELKKYGFNEKS